MKTINKEINLEVGMAFEVTREKLMEYVSIPTRDANLIKSYNMPLKKSVDSISNELVNHELDFEALIPQCINIIYNLYAVCHTLTAKRD